MYLPHAYDDMNKCRWVIRKGMRDKPGEDKIVKQGSAVTLKQATSGVIDSGGIRSRRVRKRWFHGIRTSAHVGVIGIGPVKPHRHP
jgi:hypothetical protein